MEINPFGRMCVWMQFIYGPDQEHIADEALAQLLVALRAAAQEQQTRGGMKNMFGIC
jgi:hypothetical protein